MKLWIKRKSGFFVGFWVFWVFMGFLRFFEGFCGFFEAKEGGYAIEKVATWIMKGFYAMEEVQMHLEGG